MDKDEAKVADTIDIMEEYHQYVPFKPTGEPLTLPLHADGLSCERGNDAQNARMNAADPWMQLQGLRLNAQEWHKRCTLLQVIYLYLSFTLRPDCFLNCSRHSGQIKIFVF